MAKEKKVSIFAGVLLGVVLAVIAVALIENTNAHAQQQQPFRNYKALTQASDPSGLGYAGTLVYNTVTKHLWILTGLNNATGSTWVDLGAAASLGTVGVPQGGTGLTTITSHYLIIGNGTGNVTLLAPSSTSGIPLISQGTSSNPAYGAIDLSSSSIVTNTLGVTHGGSGQAALTTHDLLIGNGTSGVTLLDPSSTSGQPLVSQGTSLDPAYAALNLAGGSSIVTGALPATNNGLPVFSGGSQLTGAKTKITAGTCILGTSCVVTVDYTSNASYFCAASDITSATNNTTVLPAYTSAVTLTITGTGTDHISYVCAGN